MAKLCLVFLAMSKHIWIAAVIIAIKVFSVMASSLHLCTKTVCKLMPKWSACPGKLLFLPTTDCSSWPCHVSIQHMYSDIVPICLVSLTPKELIFYSVVSISEPLSAVLQPVSLQGSCFISCRTSADAEEPSIILFSVEVLPESSCYSTKHFEIFFREPLSHPCPNQSFSYFFSTY